MTTLDDDQEQLRSNLELIGRETSTTSRRC